MADGVVTVTGFSETYGNYLYYETDSGFKIMYAHLKKILAANGARVSQGEALALTGNTGLSTGPHLHYSIWERDILIDPFGFVGLTYTEDFKNEYASRGETLR